MLRVPSWASHCSPHQLPLGRCGSALACSPYQVHTKEEPPCLSARSLSEDAVPPPGRAAVADFALFTFLTQADASAKLAEAMKCEVTVNEGGELQRAGKDTVTVTLESPSRHLQKAIEALLEAIAAAKRAGVDAAEQEAADLWLKQLQEAEAKVR